MSTQVPPQPGILFSVGDGIATITLNRPDALNVLDTQLVSALAEATERCAGIANLRAVVLRGTGRCFGAGGDVKSFCNADGGSRDLLRAHLDRIGSIINCLRALPAVVIAAVHGAVAGGSIGLMCAADLVVATENTRFSVAYARLGATPDAGLTYFLPRLIGERRALELMLLGEVFDAARARELGLVNFVFPTDVFERQLGDLISRVSHGPTRAYSRMKELTYRSLDNGLNEQTKTECNTFLDIMDTADFDEGVTAFLQKRPPHFSGT